MKTVCFGIHLGRGCQLIAAVAAILLLSNTHAVEAAEDAERAEAPEYDFDANNSAGPLTSVPKGRIVVFPGDNALITGVADPEHVREALIGQKFWVSGPRGLFTLGPGNGGSPEHFTQIDDIPYDSILLSPASGLHRFRVDQLNVSQAEGKLSASISATTVIFDAMLAVDTVYMIDTVPAGDGSFAAILAESKCPPAKAMDYARRAECFDNAVIWFASDDLYSGFTFSEIASNSREELAALRKAREAAKADPVAEALSDISKGVLFPDGGAGQ